jgi:hypothetical protein
MKDISTEDLLHERQVLLAGMQNVPSAFRAESQSNTGGDHTNIPAINRVQEIEGELDVRRISYD